MAKDAVWSTSKDVAFVLVFTLLRLIDIDFDSMVRQTGATKPFVFSSSAVIINQKKSTASFIPNWGNYRGIGPPTKQNGRIV